MRRAQLLSHLGFPSKLSELCVPVMSAVSRCPESSFDSRSCRQTLV